MPRLVIKTGECRGQELQLQEGANSLGRAEANDFQVDDPIVSGVHCVVHVTPFSVKVRDLGSTNGTFIDGVPVQEAEIKDGQCLRLGTVEMLLQVPPVSIAIPELTKEEQPKAAILADGNVSCLNHTDVVATRKCVQCQRTYCDECVREVRFVGGPSHFFCPACSGACSSLGVASAKPRRRSIASRVWDTMRIPFRARK